MVVTLYGMLLLSVEMSKTSWQMGKRHTNDDSENHSEDRSYLFEAMVEYHPMSIRDQSRPHQFGKKVLPGIFLGYELIAGGIWKGDILRADLEDLENLDVSDIYPRRIKAKEVLISQKDDEVIFPTADGTAKKSGRDYEFRVPTLRRK